MVEALVENCGILFWPQLILNIVVFGLVIAYCIAWRRSEITPAKKPWENQLDPLANVAVTVGLFGSVVGFISAFSGFQNGLDVDVLTRGLATAYYTTGVGLFTSLVAILGSYFLSVMSKTGRSGQG